MRKKERKEIFKQKQLSDKSIKWKNVTNKITNNYTATLKINWIESERDKKKEKEIIIKKNTHTIIKK